MKMNILSGGSLRMKKHVYVPSAPRDELVQMPVSCVLIRHGQGNVLFDTGCHPQVAVDPQERWGDLAKVIVPTMGEQDNVVHALGDVGLTAADIDLVVNSHLHMDHCGCNQFFKNATMIVHGDEITRAREPNAESRGYFAADWDFDPDFDKKFDILTGHRDLFGDDRVVLLPLPGHSPGMTGALVNLDKSGSFLLASDAVALKENLNPEIMPKNMWDVERSIKSINEIRKIQSQGATVLFGHDLEQWQGLKKGAEAYN